MMFSFITQLTTGVLTKTSRKGKTTKQAALPSEKLKKVVQDENSNCKVKNSPVMLKTFTEDYIDKNSKILSHSTLCNYRCALNSFTRFRNGEDTPMSQFCYPLLVEYQKWLSGKGVSSNAAAAYMRSLRALYNRAQKGKRQKDPYPFAGIRTGNTKTEKRATTTEEIKRLSTLELVDSHQNLCRDIFMFCFYAMGMPFVDAAHLKKGQIHGDVMEYRRQKTGRLIKVKIEACMQEIIDRYSDPDNEYVFPVLYYADWKRKMEGKRMKGNITNEKPEDIERRYRNALGFYNRRLKKLGEQVGIDINLTSYVVRHTWANEAYINNVDITVISQALGHSSTTTTEIYITGINADVVFNANRHLLKRLDWVDQAKKIAPLTKRCESQVVSSPNNVAKIHIIY